MILELKYTKSMKVQPKLKTYLYLFFFQSEWSYINYRKLKAAFEKEKVRAMRAFLIVGHVAILKVSNRVYQVPDY